MEAMTGRFNTPPYLMRVLRTFMSDRELRYQTSDGCNLWNVTYDDVFRLEISDNSYLVGYPNDLAAVIVARYTEDGQRILNQFLRRVTIWMKQRSLQLATQKTDLLTKRRIDIGNSTESERKLRSHQKSRKIPGHLLGQQDDILVPHLCCYQETRVTAFSLG
ncbi:hypothetical protein Trydic_g7931 [Trypoxylus dichotomus]